MVGPPLEMRNREAGRTLFLLERKVNKGMVALFLDDVLGVIFTGSLLSGPFTFGVNRTEYPNPLQLGRFWAFEEKDYVMFLGRQVACR